MSTETYTVPLDAETAERLKTIAETLGLTAEDAIAAAVQDYLSAWEDHLAELADAEREDLPWLNADKSA